MAHIDDLLTRVTDKGLREEFRRAIDDLRRRKKFGLVFEEHIPEIALLPGCGVHEGSIVLLRKEPDNPTQYTVEDVNGGVALIRANGSEPVEADLSDLLVVKSFGEPVYPVLTPIQTLTRAPGRPYHIVINGENFHSLQLALFGLEGKVDLIYIDPPYNSGARDWKYNNRYVDANDGWRHSKWLSMMEKRLRLAKMLLKPDGVLVVMIDEHELHHLGLLLEQVFPEYLQYMASIVVNSRGSTGNRNFGIIEEYAMFVVPNVGYDLIEPREAHVPGFRSDVLTESEELLAKIAQGLPDLAYLMEDADLPLSREERSVLKDLRFDANSGDDDEEEESDTDGGASQDESSAVYWRGAVRTGQATSFRTQRPNQFYPIYIDPLTRSIQRVGESLLARDSAGALEPPDWSPVDGLVPLWPIDEEGRERVWCFEPGRMKEEIAVGNLKVGRFNPKRNTYALNVRRVRRTETRFRERTIWWERAYDAGSNGTNILKALLGESEMFPFPKSVYAVRDVLATVVGRRQDAIILDFFAGSGTTFHSACLLNAADGGQRRSIMVTNNEVDSETAERLAAQGLFRGDPNFEKYGIFERVTRPRITAVVTGRQPSGRPVHGRHRWAGGRPLSQGFTENVAFFRLDYADPDTLALGYAFAAIVPALWLAAGSTGDPGALGAPEPQMFFPQNAPFAVLLDEDALREFLARLRDRPDITHVWLVTDSEAAFARMREQVPDGLTVGMLYRDYLRNFRIHAGVAR